MGIRNVDSRLWNRPTSSNKGLFYDYSKPIFNIETLVAQWYNLSHSSNERPPQIPSYWLHSDVKCRSGPKPWQMERVAAGRASGIKLPAKSPCRTLSAVATQIGLKAGWTRPIFNIATGYVIVLNCRGCKILTIDSELLVLSKIGEKISQTDIDKLDWAIAKWLGNHQVRRT